MKANQLKKLRNDEGAFTFLVPLTIAIVITFAVLIVGAFVIGTIGTALISSFPTTLTAFQNRAVTAMGNFSQGYSDTGNIIKVVAIITAIGMAIMAIVGIAQRVD
jgi:hypothetical protein